MSLRRIAAAEAIARLAEFSAVVDARSESEFAEDRLPGAQMLDLEALACHRGSVLAERFTHFVGQSPMRYLARWRLATAAGLLKGGDARLAQVAQQVGYESETAFNRAFKREYGVPPKRWRQHAGAAPR